MSHHWCGAKALRPGNRAAAPNSSSIRSNWLYLATRSVREAEPVLDLAGAHRHGKIRDECIFGLARTVRHHAGVTGAPRHFNGLDGLGNRANLIQLDENRIRHALGDAALQPASYWSPNRSSPTS